jgi:hypothetical protein
MDQLKQELIAAELDMLNAVEALRAALATATAVEALVLLPIIKAVTEAANTVIVFRNAREGRT